MTSYCGIAFSPVHPIQHLHVFIQTTFPLRSALDQHMHRLFLSMIKTRAIITPKILTSTFQVYSVSCDMYIQPVHNHMALCKEWISVSVLKTCTQNVI